jgi:hypothetical protein
MPVLIDRGVTVSHPEDDPHIGIQPETSMTYVLIVPSGATPDWLAPSVSRHGQRAERPRTMLQPVTFDDERDDRLRIVRLRPVDESEDNW